jgi:hypothetical protein
VLLLWSCSTPTHVGSDGSVATCDSTIQIASNHDVATTSSQSVGVPSNLCTELSQPTGGGQATLTVSSVATHIAIGIFDNNGSVLADGGTSSASWNFSCSNPCSNVQDVIVRVSGLDSSATGPIPIDLTYLFLQP